MADAYFRNLYGEESPAVIDENISLPDQGVWWVEVPGFGMLMIARLQSQEMIVRLGHTWEALLVQPDAERRFSPRSNHVKRAVKVLDDTVEVELLPDGSGEDRIVIGLRNIEGGT